MGFVTANKYAAGLDSGQYGWRIGVPAMARRAASGAQVSPAGGMAELVVPRSVRPIASATCRPRSLGVGRERERTVSVWGKEGMIMPTRNAARSLRASIDIEASPARVWKVVSDVRRTGEWSPECVRVVPIGGVRAGGWMVGVNRRGSVRWATLSRIVRFEPEREIAWKVVTNGSRWTYRLESIDSGTRLVETRETPRGVGVIASRFTRKNLGGQSGHDDELELAMSTGLERIKSIVTD